MELVGDDQRGVEIGGITDDEIWKELTPEMFKIDPQDIEDLKTKLTTEPFKTAFDNGLKELNDLQAFWAEKSQRDFSNQDTIPLKEYLAGRKGLVTSAAVFKQKRIGKEWTEHVRVAKPEELLFVETTRQIAGGNFSEVLQFALLNQDNQIFKRAIASGGLEVSQDALDEIEPWFHEHKGNLKQVFIMHNHPDEYGLVKVPANYPENTGLITVGGLSKRDIDFAEDSQRKFGLLVPTTMIAVNERGFTFASRITPNAQIPTLA